MGRTSEVADEDRGRGRANKIAGGLWVARQKPLNRIPPRSRMEESTHEHTNKKQMYFTRMLVPDTTPTHSETTTAVRSARSLSSGPNTSSAVLPLTPLPPSPAPVTASSSSSNGETRAYRRPCVPSSISNSAEDVHLLLLLLMMIVVVLVLFSGQASYM